MRSCGGSAKQPRLRRDEAERKATLHAIDTGYGGIVEVAVEPVLDLRETGVEHAGRKRSSP